MTVIEILEARRAELTVEMQDLNRAIEAIRGSRGPSDSAVTHSSYVAFGRQKAKLAKASAKTAKLPLDRPGKRVVSEATKAKMRAAHAARKARKAGDTDVPPALEVHYENGEAIGAEE